MKSRAFNHKAFEPVIKWSGSKHSVANQISSLFPHASRYIEPFVGGGSLMPFRTSNIALAGDVVEELIELWTQIRDNVEFTASQYESRWLRLQQEGHTAYYDIRSSFNKTRNPYDLLFLTRTCVNGLIRFNSKGEFNNSLHHTRPGIAPSRLRSVLLKWCSILKEVSFIAADYRETLQYARPSDLVFLDPPYAGTKGRYIPNTFDLEDFYFELDRLNALGVRWVLTLDGWAGSRRYNAEVPPDIYKKRFDLTTGNSPFTRLMRSSLDTVTESVYLNFEPVASTLY